MIRLSAILLLVASMALSCNSEKPDYQLHVFNTSGSEWGYSILFNNKTIIYQKHIPCIAGTKPFASEKDARRTGKLVIQKIKNGQLPRLKIAELEELKIKLDNE